MRILFFGKLGDMVGREVHVDLPAGGCTVAELRQMLAVQYPFAERELTGLSLRACVDDRIVGENSPISVAASVEFLPPLSGG